MAKIFPVILSGGNGTRLWPRSRKGRPKPFLPLVGRTTLFEEAVLRCTNGEMFEAPIVVTGNEHLAWAEAQALPIAGNTQFIVEPESRNTAPAIALAAHALPAEAVMLVCPADHHISDAAAFLQAARKAAELAMDGWLVAFGIEADYPETGFGYILRGDALGEGYRVERFTEKPALDLAKSFLAQGGYSWNGGIFAFQAGRYLAELALHRPEMAAAVERSFRLGRREGRIFHPDAPAFASIAGESIDFAVMEKTDRAAVVPVDMGWSDVGNWSSLRRLRGNVDDKGNQIHGKADVVDCRNVMVDTDGPRVSVVGLDDVIVVVDGDEILVTSAKAAQSIGKLRGAIDQ